MAAPGTAYDDPELGADPQVGHMDDFVDTTADNGGSAVPLAVNRLRRTGSSTPMHTLAIIPAVVAAEQLVQKVPQCSTAFSLVLSG